MIIDVKKYRFFSLIELLLLAIIIITIFVPINPGMPIAGLDPSWVYGLNQAISQDLSMGRDLIFTYGPYGYLYTKQYQPGLYPLMICSSLYFTFCFFIALKNYADRFGLIIFLIILIGLNIGISKDALFIIYPLLAAISLYKTINAKHSEIFLFIIFSALGLLPLIKGTMGISSFVCIIFSVFYALNRKNSKLGILLFLIPIASMMFLWVISGQKFLDIGPYFYSTLQIISGYSEAMSSNGKISEIILFLLITSAQTFFIYRYLPEKRYAKIYVTLSFALFLFVSFKGGFVRHDGHAMLAANSVLFASLLIKEVINKKTTTFIVFIAIFYYLFVDSHYYKTSTDKFIDNIQLHFRENWYGLKNQLNNPIWLANRFTEANSKIRSEHPIPRLNGKVDIYSYDQSALLASENSWAPRPVFQSYSAYTPYLLKTNAEHLLGENAPDSIVFKIQPIDGRLPSMEDGASWPILISKYSLDSFKEGLILLKKSTKLNNSDVPQLTYETQLLGEEIFFGRPGINFAKIEIRKTLVGKIFNTLFKLPELTIEFNLKNGSRVHYRVVSGMLNGGFVLSPLVENTSQFAFLYGPQSLMSNQEVTSFRINTPGLGSIFWDKKFIFGYGLIESSQIKNADTILGIKKAEEIAAASIQMAKKCEGVIDAINGAKLPTNGVLSASGILKVSGWMALSIENNSVPKSTGIMLVNAVGKGYFFRGNPVKRVDVGSYLKNTYFNNSGYEVNADISKLSGEYILKFIVSDGSTLEFCPQFSSTVVKIK
jgi:hypothetical protein